MHSVDRVVIGLVRDGEALDRVVGLDRVRRAGLRRTAARAVRTGHREVACDDDLALAATGPAAL